MRRRPPDGRGGSRARAAPVAPPRFHDSGGMRDGPVLPSSAGDGERAYLTGLRPSRIRAVQAARNGWTSVDRIGVDSGQAVALRGMLELFGVHVRRFAIGQARQLVRALG